MNDKFSRPLDWYWYWILIKSQWIYFKFPLKQNQTVLLHIDARLLLVMQFHIIYFICFRFKLWHHNKMEVFWIYCLIDEYSTLLINHFTCFKHTHSSLVHITHMLFNETRTHHIIKLKPNRYKYNFLLNAIKIGIFLIYQLFVLLIG